MALLLCAQCKQVAAQCGLESILAYFLSDGLQINLAVLKSYLHALEVGAQKQQNTDPLDVQGPAGICQSSSLVLMKQDSVK